MKKKLLVVLCTMAVLMSAFVFTACGESYDGTYYAYVSDIKADVSYIEIDGNDFILCSNGVEIELDFKISGGEFTASFEGETVLSGLIEDGVITTDQYGSTIIYKTDDAVSSSASSSIDDIFSSLVVTTSLSGTYYLTYGDEVYDYMSFRFDGDVVYFGTDGTEIACDVVLTDGVYYITYMGEDLGSGTVSGNNFLYTFQGATLTFTKSE